MTQSELRLKNKRAARRAVRSRARTKVSGVPRLSVFRSARYMWAQVIDDTKSETIASASSKGIAGNKTEQAFAVGKAVARAALAKKINQVVFDRGAYRYHGRVKAVAEGAREGGLQI